MKPIFIATVFNRQLDVLEKSLCGWAAQTNKDFVVHYVDDGSTTNTLDQAIENIVGGSGILDVRITRTDTKRDRPGTFQLPSGHNNPAYAFNVGIQQSIAWGFDAIFLFSSDIVAEPHLRENLQRYLPQLKGACVHARAWDPTFRHLGTPVRPRPVVSQHDFCSASVPRPLGWFWGTHVENIVASRIEQGQYYAEGFLQGFAYEDGDFTGRVALATGKVVIDDRLEVMHQPHPRSYDNNAPGLERCTINAAYARSKWGGEATPWDGFYKPIRRMVYTSQPTERWPEMATNEERRNPDDTRFGLLEFRPEWP